MVTTLLDRPVVPIVSEKTGRAPDKAGVEQRREHAEEAFRNRAETDGIEVETKLLYGTDVAEAIQAAADDVNASTIAFSSRGGSRWIDLVSGDVRSKRLTDHDRPVVVLPSGGERS